MIEKKTDEPFQLGDRVKIRHSNFRGRIVELRGALGPGGVHIFRVRYRRKPTPAYVEVREDQLVRLPPRQRPESKQNESS